MIASSSIHSLCRATVAFVWVYHGLVPKILGPHRDEIALALAHGLPSEHLTVLLKLAGLAEVLFGIVILLARQSRWPFVVSIAMLIILLIDVTIVAPEYLMATFNPASLNIPVIVLSVIAYATLGKQDGPSNTG